LRIEPQVKRALSKAVAAGYRIGPLNPPPFGGCRVSASDESYSRRFQARLDDPPTRWSRRVDRPAL